MKTLKSACLSPIVSLHHLRTPRRFPPDSERRACTMARPRARAQTAAGEISAGASATTRSPRQSHRLHQHHQHHEQIRVGSRNEGNNSSSRRRMSSAVDSTICIMTRTPRLLYRHQSASPLVSPSGDKLRTLLERSSSCRHSPPASMHPGRSFSSSSNNNKSRSTAAEPSASSSIPPSARAGAAFPVVSSVDPIAAEQEAAIAQLAESGRWEEALEALRGVRSVSG